MPLIYEVDFANHFSQKKKEKEKETLLIIKLNFIIRQGTKYAIAIQH